MNGYARKSPTKNLGRRFTPQNRTKNLIRKTLLLSSWSERKSFRVVIFFQLTQHFTGEPIYRAVYRAVYRAMVHPDVTLTF